jgi:hypothetical protein
MVDGVLHNAAMGMKVRGVVLEPERAPRHALARWFGRGGAALGAAASLVVGAVLGGAFEGIPVVLPPPVSAATVAQAPAGHALVGVRPQDDAIGPGPVRTLRRPAPMGDVPPAATTSFRSASASPSAQGASGCMSAHATCSGPPSRGVGGDLSGASELEQAAALVRSVMAGVPAELAAKLAATVSNLTAATSGVSGVLGDPTPPGT